MALSNGVNGSGDTSKTLIIIVTGANGGIGFGTCHRLLVQLSQPNPPDAVPHFAETNDAYEYSHAGLTLILACRDRVRAEAARDKLYRLLDAHIAKIPAGAPEHDYASEFRSKLVLAIHRLDLSSVRSVLEFGEEMAQKYPYISHLICNAGVATFKRLDIRIFLMQCIESPLKAVQYPAFNVQKAGVTSGDGLGFVWQCNVFGHYVLFRTIQPLLTACSTSSGLSMPARVLWTSSVDSLPSYHPKRDWQLVETGNSYQASKFQLDLMILDLCRRARKGEGAEGVRHILMQPGIVPTSIAADLLRPQILRYLMIGFFYICRLLGSPFLSFSVYAGAFAAVHLSIAPLGSIPVFSKSNPDVVMKYGTESDRWGRARIGCEEIADWDEYPDEGRSLVDRCEALYRTFLNAERKGDDAANG